MVFFYFYYILIRSVHYLVLLIIVELLVLFSFILITIQSISYVYSLFFLLVAVCMGAYSICVYISFSRSKINSYLMRKVGGIF